jgi:hypothetical protein
MVVEASMVVSVEGTEVAGIGNEPIISGTV